MNICLPWATDHKLHWEKTESVAFTTVSWGLAEVVACVRDKYTGSMSEWSSLRILGYLFLGMVTLLQFLPYPPTATKHTVLCIHSISQHTSWHVCNVLAHIPVSKAPSQLSFSRSRNAHEFQWWYCVKYFKLVLFLKSFEKVCTLFINGNNVFMIHLAANNDTPPAETQKLRVAALDLCFQTLVTCWFC